MTNNIVTVLARFWTTSIRRQLILGIALVHAVLMTIFVVDLVHRQSRFLHEQSIAQAEGLAKTIASSSTSWVLAHDIAGLNEVLQSQSSFPDLRYAMVVSPRGKVIAHTDKSKNNLYLSDAISRRLLDSEAQAQTLLANNLLVDVACPIVVDDELIGWARVGVGQEKIAAGLGKITFNGIIYTVIAILAGSIFAYFMAKNLTGGLRHLVRIAEGNRLGRRELRANLQRQDEIGQLGRDLNQMLDELIKQEQDLRKREAELRKITNVLPGPVARVDKDGRYLFVSAAYERWFGKRPGEAIGHTQKEILSKAHFEKVSPYYKRALAGEKVDFEISVSTPSGEILYGQFNAIPDYDAAGEVCGFFVTVADITERKKSEQNAQKLRDQLIQATKMEAVGHLTAGIAHDFNNMLGAIMGYAELSKHFIPSGSSEKIDGYLDEILKASNRAKELISQMLTFSRLTPDTPGENAPVTLLTPVVKEVVSLLRSSIPSTIDLNYEVEDADLKSLILPINLHQIILNLGINARDAIGEYGKINITLGKYVTRGQVCDSCQQHFAGEFAQLTVSDTGTGIELHVLKNIFNPFFTTKVVGKGTGMGLPVVHGLVHALGGHIQVESILGKGTAISVLLPLALTAASDESLINIPVSTGGTLVGLSIMVVDDELFMTAMLQEFLSMRGAQITTFNSPLAAWTAFEHQPHSVDVVITDETMPGLSGMHLAERMLKLRPDLPIILCTGYSDHATAELAEKAGLAGFFYKPLKLNVLLERILLVVKKTLG